MAAKPAPFSRKRLQLNAWTALAALIFTAAYFGALFLWTTLGAGSGLAVVGSMAVSLIAVVPVLLVIRAKIRQSVGAEGI